VCKKSSDLLRLAMIDCLKEQPHHRFTPDRGKEFSRHDTVTAALDQVPFYFPLPSHPRERETHENTNGLLQEYFPKALILRMFRKNTSSKKWMHSTEDLENV